MNQWKELLEYCINKELAKIILSNSREKDGIRKVEIRPVLLKGELYFQAGAYTQKQVQHYNLTAEELYEKIAQWMELMKQMEVLHPAGRMHVLISKKGKMTVKRSKSACPVPTGDLSHNRKKKYILDPEVKVPFLVDLGVQTKEGKIVQSRYDKFRQINRFLEFIEDIVLELPKDREVVLIDFGCGKSYLTFAMYYYLHELKGYDVRIIGLDLKEDVIANCQALADKYGYEKLTFLAGDIADYEGVDQVDMVVTLHACDTATDYAIAKAVRWGAKVILSVPCCQHEINGQIQNDLLQPVLKYGLIRERMSALLTDAMRANLLEEAGYQVQVMEFIDMEHTPKNILIRGIKNGKKQSGEELDRLMGELHVSPTLAALMRDGKDAADD
jgi:SAM-dependent methyltransferase